MQPTWRTARALDSSRLHVCLLQRMGVRLVHQQLPRLQRGEAELGGPLRLLLHGRVGGVLAPPHAVPSLLRRGPLPGLDHWIGARAAARPRLMYPMHPSIVSAVPLEPCLCLLLLRLHLGGSLRLPDRCRLAWPGLLPCGGCCGSRSRDGRALSLPGLQLHLLRVLLLVRTRGTAAPAGLASSRPMLVVALSPSLALFWLAALSSSLLSGGGPCLPLAPVLLAALSSSLLRGPSLLLLLLLGAGPPVERRPTLSSSPSSVACLRLLVLVPGLVGLQLLVLVLLLHQALLVPVLHQLLVVVALLRLGRGVGLAHAPAGSHAHELHGPTSWQGPGIGPGGVCLQ